MVRLIMGTKGSGKTKQLIELINNAAKDEPGNVVCIEANRNLTYDIHYHIRLIDAAEYKLNSYDMFRGFISGLYAGNYDISHVFIDSLCRAIGRDVDKDAATGLTPCFDQAAPYYEQARLVFLCRKLYRQDMEESAFLDKGLLEKWYDNDLHRIFIGEIVKVLEKE